jgi:hypothetical protein
MLSKVIAEFQPPHLLANLSAKWLSANTHWLDEPFPGVKPDLTSMFLAQTAKKIVRLRCDHREVQAVLGDKRVQDHPIGGADAAWVPRPRLWRLDDL